MLDSFLRSQDSQWPATIAALALAIHEVDRAATRIWFSLFPLVLHEIAEQHGADPVFDTHYQLRGAYRLHSQVDASHWFLFGHAYWPEVKRAILAHEGVAASLEDLCRAIAPAPQELTLGITAIGLMTLRQVGRETFAGTQPAAGAQPAKTPEQILEARRHGPPAGGFFAKLTKKSVAPRVVFNENDPEAWFALIPSQEITNAAEQDKRPHHLKDSRCFENMGPIPVECRSGKCGTCWVGILGGQEHLNELSEWEKKRLAYFGYFDSGFESTDDPKPLIRLACQAQATNHVSIVIPPWCGVYGEVRREAWHRRPKGLR